MTIRAKIKLTSITQHVGISAKTVKFYPQYDNDIPEDRRFQKATPGGFIELLVDNPVALDQFILGEYYYFDFTPCL